jgi:hypothetical protein
MLCQPTFREATPVVRHRSDQVEIAAEASTRAVRPRRRPFQRRCRKGKENRDGQRAETDLGLQACRAHPPEAPRPTPKSRRPCRRNALQIALRRTPGHDYCRARCQHERSGQSASRRALTYTTPRRQSAQYVPIRLPEMHPRYAAERVELPQQKRDLVPTSERQAHHDLQANLTITDVRRTAIRRVGQTLV